MKHTPAASTLTWTQTCWARSSHTTARCARLPSPLMSCHETNIICSGQIVISTGKSDWERDITDDKDSLASAVCEISTNKSNRQMSPTSPASPKPASPPPSGKGVRPATGLFHTADSTRTSVLNGSHKTVCHEYDQETVLVFPDFKVVTEVQRSMQGARELWESAVDPSIGRDGAYLEKSALKTWVLPYSCVILLCECCLYFRVRALGPNYTFPRQGSHKKRDNRCGIAAPKLEHGTSISRTRADAILTESPFSLHQAARGARLGRRHADGVSVTDDGASSRGPQRDP